MARRGRSAAVLRRMVMQAARTQRIAIRTGAGRGAMTSAARGVAGCTMTYRFHVPPPPPPPGGSGKTGARSATTLYVSIHSPSRVPGNILQDFEAYGRGVTEAHGTLTPAVLVRGQPTVPRGKRVQRMGQGKPDDLWLLIVATVRKYPNMRVWCNWQHIGLPNRKRGIVPRRPLHRICKAPDFGFA